MKTKILVVLGPTATGKTDLALILAKKFNGELVSCDSRQVYVGLDIGSGKLPSGSWKLEVGSLSRAPAVSEVELKSRGWKKGKGFWEIDGVRIWMYDVVSPNIQYTVADYVKDADRVIGEISERGNLPILVGGTGFYLKALLEGLSNLAIPVDIKLRKELQRLSLKEMQKRLQKLSYEKWEKMNQSDRQNSRRLIRAIEVVMMYSYRKKTQNSKFKSQKYDVLKIGLTAPRKILYEKINERVKQWINDGIIDEVNKLLEDGVTKKRFKELGLEYGVAIEYLDNEVDHDQMIIKMQTKVRQYANRQLTWFRKEKDVVWFDITEENFLDNVEKLVTKWYHQTHASESRHLS